MRSGDYLGQAVGPMALGSPGGASEVMYPGQVYQTALLDLTVPTLGIEIVPAKPGHVPRIGQSKFLIETIAGTQTVPAQVQGGNNAAHTNLFASQAIPSNATVNAVTAPPGLATGVTSSAVTSQVIPNAPVIMDITAGAQGTGGFLLRGKFVVWVNWIAVG